MSASPGGAPAEKAAPSRFVFADWYRIEPSGRSAHSQDLQELWPSELWTAYVARNLALQPRGVRATGQDPFQGLLELQRSYSGRLRESLDVSQMKIMFRYMAQRTATLENRVAKLEKRTKFYREVTARLIELRKTAVPVEGPEFPVEVDWEQVLPDLRAVAEELGWRVRFEVLGQQGNVTVQFAPDMSDSVAEGTLEFFSRLAGRLDTSSFEALSFEFEVD